MSNRQTVQDAIDQFKIQALNFGYEFIKNAAVRQEYVSNIQAMSDDMMQAYTSGKYSAEQAAKLAHEARNKLLDAARARQTNLGRSVSRSMKEEGKAFEELMEYYARSKFSKGVDQLDDLQKERVFQEIVEASGRNRASATTLTQRLKWGGRVLWVVAIGVSAYNIGTSENKAWATGREATTLGGGFAGGAAGGAIAGIWCGPVGIAVGAAVGGVFGALLSDEVYLEVAGTERVAVNRFIDPYTTAMNTDEEGIANALVNDAGINMDLVYLAFLELDANYSADADDVALQYVKKVHAKRGSVLHALQLNKDLINLLIRLLDEGWTSNEETQAIRYLTQLRGD